jgi:tetratricopeptide (TPR) repeat protein
MDETQQWLAEGIARVKAGQREQARELLLRVVGRDERNVQAWLWLSGVVESDEDRRVALENVLTLDPQNAVARAGLDWLDQVAAPMPLTPEAGGAGLAPAQPGDEDALEARDEPPAETPTLDKRQATESEGCPYCGLAVSESDARCPHCAQPLILHAPKQADFSFRAVLLVALWLVQAAVDLIGGAVIVIAWMTVGHSLLSGLAVVFVRAYLAGTAWKSALPVADLQRMTLVLIVFDVVASAWSLAVAVILPGRRPAAPAVSLFLAALHIVLPVGGFIVGATSLWVMLARLALALFIGFLALEAQGDFAWESVRQRLEFDQGLKSSMDYYSRGRYYRRMAQTTKAILHWERAVLLAPDQFAFRVALGNAYYAMSRYDDAAEQFKAALRIKPDAADVRQFLDMVEARASPGESRVV